MKPLLHVLFDPSSAATLRQALAGQGRTEKAVCLYDDFSFGPIGVDGAARLAWIEEALGIADWESFMRPTAAFLAASCAPDILPVAWVSRRDVSSHAGFLWWLSQLGDAPCRIVDVTDLVIGDDPADPASLAIATSSLTAAEMAGLLGTEVELDPVERARHSSRWRQLVSEDAPLRIVDRQCALVSAPLTQFDALLLSCATAAWRNIGLVVGDAKATQLRGGFQPAAYFLLHSRAQRLAETGALEWRGDLSSLPDCEVRLPPAARAVRTPAATA